MLYNSVALLLYIIDKYYFYGAKNSKILFTNLKLYAIIKKNRFSERVWKMIYAVKTDFLTRDECALFESIQGIVNRKKAEIYADTDSYMRYIENEEFEYTDIGSLVYKYKDRFAGYVTYKCTPDDVSINMAATISAAYDILGVPESLQSLVHSAGIEKLYDLSAVSGSSEERQKTVFDYCKPRLSRCGLVHQVVKPESCHTRLRDFAIANRFACVYTKETAQGRKLLSYILSYLNKNIPVLGWTDSEIPFVKTLSEFGDYVIPMDWSANHSFFGLNPDATVKQQIKPENVNNNKHFLAIVVSDGDNIQWLERDFSTTSTFGQRLASPMDYKMTFTLSPSFVKFAPAPARYIYSQARRERFMASVSGIGYCNPQKYPFERLSKFADMSAEQMKRADLDTITLLDNLETFGEDFRDRIDLYARHENIKGGVYELDPDRYRAGEGKIFWSSNGKPFVSVRYSFWPLCGDTSLVNDAWIKSYADKINSMPVSPDSEDGYTVLNVNPWTTNIEQLDKMVSQLSDHIELVYFDEMVSLICTNFNKKRLNT